MKKRVFKLLVLSIMLLSFIQVKGQGFTTKGTDFWLGFMENYLTEDTLGTDRMKVYITTDNIAASGTISVPLGGWSQNFVVAPNSTFEVTLPTNLVMCTMSDAIEPKGVHVTSDNPVSVYQLNYVQFTSDANINIPTSSLGKKYRATTYLPSGVSNPFTEVSVSEILVVAAYDNTVIRIVPKCNTWGSPGHGANIPFNITLNQGEVYQMKSYPSPQYSLTGSLIELDTTASNNCKTFAVFSGNLCAFVPGDSMACNHICEEMMPINTWGKQYITVPLKTRTSDVFRIVGQQNGTIFTINGGFPQGLNAGGIYEEDIAGPTFIDSNYPISVAQFSKGAGGGGFTDADPFMIMINPLEQTIRRIVFNSFTSSVITAYYVNLVTRTAFTNLVNLDGANISASFLPVPGNPTYSYAQLTIAQGNHILGSDSGLIANVYGYGFYESYGYIAGSTVNNLETIFYITSPTESEEYYDFLDTICRGTSLEFKATYNQYINDYFWDFGDGTPIVHGQTVNHTYNSPGNFHIVYYSQRNGTCSLDSILWEINVKCCNVPPVINATSPVCFGEPIIASEVSTFNPNASYVWNFVGGNVVSGSGQGPYQVYWNDLGIDTMWVYVTEPNCMTDTAFYVFEIYPIPTSTFTVVSPLCPGEISTITYTGNAPPSANYQWNLDNGNIVSGSGQGPLSVIWLNSGVHNVSLTVTRDSCSTTTTVPVTIFDEPNALFTANPQTTFVGEPLINFYDNSVHASTWAWNFGDIFATQADNYSSIQFPSHSYYNIGDYTIVLTVTSPDGCIDTVAGVVHVIDINSFYIPNAFTPNGNGLNEIFQPYGNPLDYTLYVFDRWGEQIFAGKNQGWDGKYKGNYVQQDLYVWLLVYSFNKEDEKTACGKVTLIK